MDVKGKNCIVTGGADGIGLACCRELLKQGAQKVILLDINQTRAEDAMKKLQQEFGKDKCLSVKCDVSRVNEVETALKTCSTQLKQIDLLVNCAFTVNEIDTENSILCNLNGIINTCQQMMRIMSKEHGGRGGLIVNMSSVLALHPLASCPVYCATRRAVITLTRCLSLPAHSNKTGVKLITLCVGVNEEDINNDEYRIQAEWVSEFQRELKTLPRQETDRVGEALIQLLKSADNGSTWVTEGNQQIYEVQIPTRDQLKRRV